MPNQVAANKRMFTVRIDKQLRSDYLAACKRKGLDGTKVVERLMREVVRPKRLRETFVIVSLLPEEDTPVDTGRIPVAILSGS